MGIHQFTYNYHQPKDYRFSLDSIHFAELIAKEILNKQNIPDLKILDVCAGCGVIGFELSYYVPQLRYIDFLEIQERYHPYFLKNVEQINRPEINFNWIQKNYTVLLENNYISKYDIIVSNPPYFFPDQGTLSPSDFKNRCRFFLDSTYEVFILGLCNSLNSNGECYFLQRDLSVHKIDLLSILYNLIPRNFNIEIIKHFRNVDVIKLFSSS